MNRLFLLAILCLGVLLNWQPSEAKGLRVSRARRFFNRQMAERAAADTLPKGVFYLREITPLWEHAAAGEDSLNRYLRIPVQASNGFRLWQDDFEGEWSWAPVRSGLLAVEEKATGRTELCLAFCLPDPDSRPAQGEPRPASEQPPHQPPAPMPPAGYDGLIVWSDFSGYVVRCTEFRQGHLRRQIDLRRTPLSPLRRHEALRQLLDGKVLQYGTDPASGAGDADPRATVRSGRWETGSWFYIDSGRLWLVAGHPVHFQPGGPLIDTDTIRLLHDTRYAFGEPVGDPAAHRRLSVAEAQELFGEEIRSRTSDAPASRGIFHLSDPVPCWEDATASEDSLNRYLRIPLRTRSRLRILRPGHSASVADVVFHLSAVKEKRAGTTRLFPVGRIAFPPGPCGEEETPSPSSEAGRFDSLLIATDFQGFVTACRAFRAGVPVAEVDTRNSAWSAAAQRRTAARFFDGMTLTPCTVPHCDTLRSAAGETSADTDRTPLSFRIDPTGILRPDSTRMNAPDRRTDTLRETGETPSGTRYAVGKHFFKPENAPRFTTDEARALFERQTTERAAADTAAKGPFFFKDIAPDWERFRDTDLPPVIPIESANSLRLYYDRDDTGTREQADVLPFLSLRTDRRTGDASFLLYLFIPHPSADPQARPDTADFTASFPPPNFTGLLLCVDLSGYVRQLWGLLPGRITRILSADSRSARPELRRLLAGKLLQYGSNTPAGTEWNTQQWITLDDSGRFGFLLDTDADGRPDTAADTLSQLDGTRYAVGSSLFRPSNPAP